VDHAHDQSKRQPAGGRKRARLRQQRLALLTPGPVVITTGFIGYLVAGLPGAVVVAVATFRAIC
jgi:hypothetical protein